MVKINSLVACIIMSVCFLGFSRNIFGCNAPVTACPGFRTQTQGGWGATPNGNNPAMYLRNNFAAAFPNGLEIGCTNKLRLTSASAVQAFLPSGGTARALNAGTMTNPGGSYSNVFAGQLVALTISVQMDITFANFSSSNTLLKDLVIGSGSFQGWTVGNFLAEANKKIGGCSSVNFSFSTFNDVARRINEAYVDGVTKTSFLKCPDPIICNISAEVVGRTPVTCFGGSNGSANLTVTGGTAPITFLWSNGATTEDLSNVPAGTYTVKVKDKNNCIANASVQILEPTVLEVNSNSTNPSCFGGSNGTASLSISGGTQSYSIVWGNGETTENISNLSAGSISYVVTDGNGCTKEGNVSLSNPAELSVSVSVTKGISCNNVCDGSLTANAMGGTGAYSYVWSNTSSANPLTGLCSGPYSVSVTDENGCTASANQELSNPSPLALVPSTTPSSNCECNGTASVSVSGGTEPYNYAWSQGPSGVNTLSGLCVNTAIGSVTVTDANGCQATATFGNVKFAGVCYGTEIVDFFQGKRADGSNVDLERSNPDLAKGAPQNTNLPGTFYSLGFGGHVTVKVAGGIYNRPGKDFRVVETTYWAWGCTRYEERARVYISPDNGNTWIDKGQICQDGEIDINPITCINMVKIVDESIAENFVNEPVLADGFDVDGIECIGATANRMATSGSDSEVGEEGSATWVSKSVSLFPNPAEDKLGIKITGAFENEKVEIVLFDNMGRVAKSIEMTPGIGSSELNLPINELKSGIYHVRVKGSDLNYSQKVVKK
jgi:hypothetical protein